MNRERATGTATGARGTHDATVHLDQAAHDRQAQTQPALRAVAGLITPVPGGVGPMTIAMLLRNTVRAAQRLAAA